MCKRSAWVVRLILTLALHLCLHGSQLYLLIWKCIHIYLLLLWKSAFKNTAVHHNRYLFRVSFFHQTDGHSCNISQLRIIAWQGNWEKTAVKSILDLFCVRDENFSCKQLLKLIFSNRSVCFEMDSGFCSVAFRFCICISLNMSVTSDGLCG